MRLISLLGAALLATHVPAALAQQAAMSFTTTRVPTESFGPGLDTRGGTAVLGINDAGQFVGTFGERNATILGLRHGMIHDPQPNLPLSLGYGAYDRTATSIGPARLGEMAATAYLDPKYHYLDLRPAQNSDFNDGVTTPNAINNAGVVVGRVSADYLDRGAYAAFIYDSRTQNVQVLNAPGAVSTEFMDINNAGQIVGNGVDVNGRSFAFLFSNGVYTAIADPNAGAEGTFVSGLNDLGDVVGSWGGAASYGFVYANGSFTDFQARVNTATYATDINNAGQVVGYFSPSGKRTSFSLLDGVFTDIDLNGSGSTYARSINNNGVIAGTMDGDLSFFATVHSVPEPVAAWLWGAGLVVLAGLAARRRHG